MDINISNSAFLKYLIAIILLLLAKIFLDVGLLQIEEGYHDENCIFVPSDFASEDLTVDNDHGVLYLRFDNRAEYINTEDWIEQATKLRKVENGGLAVFRISDSSFVNITLVDFDQESHDFHPHGFSYYQGFIYVINHRADGDHVEIFQVLNHSELKYIESVSHPLITFAQNIEVVGDRKFYVTVWDFKRSGIADREDTTVMIYCKVVDQISYCETVLDDIVVDDMTISGDSMFILSGFEKQLFMYQQGEDGALKLINQVSTHSTCDNIHVSDQKQVILTCHSRFYEYVAAMTMNDKHPFKSEIYLFDQHDVFQELMTNRNFSTTSATVHQNTIYATSRFHTGLLKCAL